MYVDSSVCQAWQIDSSKILSTTPKNLDLSSLALKYFEFPSELMIKVQAKLNKVVMYQSGGHYKRDCESIKFGNCYYFNWSMFIRPNNLIFKYFR